MKIIADAQIPHIEDYLESYGELILLEGRHITPRDVQNADLLIVRSITPVNEALLANSKVRFVGSVTAGADHLDTKWLDQANIAWNCAAGFNAPPVADYVVSVIAALQKNSVLPHKAKAAVIGVGNVGRLVVSALQKLGFQILLCDPVRAQREIHFNSVKLEEINDCDLILLHVPLTRAGEFPTYHFIDEKFLSRQKNGSVLINASRGAVVDSAALSTHGNHMHWCLDVWENEPNISKQLLKETFIGTPHIAGYSVQSKIRGIDMIYRIACEREIIQPLPFIPRLMSDQLLAISDNDLTWQDIVLSVFDPMKITEQMRHKLLDADNYGILFDEMRNQFNYRHEFRSTKIDAPNLSADNKIILRSLGFKIS